MLGPRADDVGVEPSPYGAPRFSRPLAVHTAGIIQIGARGRIRTDRLRSKNPVLFHVSFARTIFARLESNQRMSGFKDRRLTVLATRDC